MFPEETVEPITLLPSDVPLPHERLLAWVTDRRQWEDRLVAKVMQNPLESLITLLVSSSAAFYLAERRANPRINTFWDALYYITTCASVGYADVFAVTQAGKVVASVAFTFGPALCAQAFDRASPGGSEHPTGEPAVVEKLQAILAELQKLNAKQ
jgi:hypothetical protein